MQHLKFLFQNAKKETYEGYIQNIVYSPKAFIKLYIIIINNYRASAYQHIRENLKRYTLCQLNGINLNIY